MTGPFHLSTSLLDLTWRGACENGILLLEFLWTQFLVVPYGVSVTC
jgi:hypothetical protein